jgi:orotate phosphoribosyltransferase
MSQLTPLGEALFARALLRGRFTLRSGAVSNRYFDKYLVSTDPVLLRMTAHALAAAVHDATDTPDVLLAPELGAVPLAVAVSLDIGIPYAIARSARKAYGSGKQLEGMIVRGHRAVLLEDVVTTGGAAREAVSAAREAGLVVDLAVCVLDRDGGGREALAADGVELRALLTGQEMEFAFQHGYGVMAQADPASQLARPGPAEHAMEH